MRSLWKGAISFGLVSIPIKLYPATEDHSPKFRQLHAECKSPIKYQKICPVCNRALSDDEIVRGYEYEPGKFVIIEDEDLENIPAKEAKTIDILDFIDIKEIDPIYYNKPYFLAPEEIGMKAYVLLRNSMKNTNKAAIAKTKIRDKESLVCIRVYDEYLALETMHYPDEIRKTEYLPPVKEIKLTESEMNMSEQLINVLSSKFDPQKYTDEYRRKLLEIIQSKIQNLEIEQPIKPPDNVLNLVEVLKASIEAVKKETPNETKKAPRKKKGA